MIMNSDRIDKLSLALKYVANVSIAYYAELTAMLVSMRTMVMQNRVALDLLLAEKGNAPPGKGKRATWKRETHLAEKGNAPRGKGNGEIPRQAMEKYREGQSNIEFVFIDIL